MPRHYRAGDSVEDFCRACKTDRMHTVIAADDSGTPIRVSCGYCHSEHNYRGGPRVGLTPRPTGPQRIVSDAHHQPVSPQPEFRRPAASAATRSGTEREPFPLVSDRERTAPPMAANGTDDLELLLRRVIREETGITPVAPAEKWRNGTLVLRPGTPGLQDKTWPIETFFHKVVMLRNRLRTLEQQINAAELPEDVKVRLQGYISGCYGSLTSFNVLFADEDDQFKGGGAD
jgi:hypothetical protein